MKRMLIAGTFVIAAAGQVIAADMPVPYPAPQPPASYYPAAAPFNWGGFYVGANGGYGFGSSSWSAPPATLAGFIISPAIETGSFNPRGFLAGGTLGLNLQASAFVFGVEADGDWTNLDGSSSNAYCSSNTAGATCETKSVDLHVARARFGYGSIGSLSMVRAASPAPASKLGLTRPQPSMAPPTSAIPWALAWNSPLPTTGRPRSNTSIPTSAT